MASRLRWSGRMALPLYVSCWGKGRAGIAAVGIVESAPAADAEWICTARVRNKRTCLILCILNCKFQVYNFFISLHLLDFFAIWAFVHFLARPLAMAHVPGRADGRASGPIEEAAGNREQFSRHLRIAVHEPPAFFELIALLTEIKVFLKETLTRAGHRPASFCDLGGKKHLKPPT